MATNSSWGIDNADPEDYPLWCNFYDTLGTAGILSCAATANNDVNAIRHFAPYGLNPGAVAESGFDPLVPRSLES